MRIFVTGGCGYKGSILVPKLLDRGYVVTVIDTMWFGNFLSPHKNLNIIRGMLEIQIHCPCVMWM